MHSGTSPTCTHLKVSWCPVVMCRQWRCPDSSGLTAHDHDVGRAKGVLFIGGEEVDQNYTLYVV